MRLVILWLLLMLISGCAQRHGEQPLPPAAEQHTGLIVIPDTPDLGKVSMFNASAGYVIITLTLGEEAREGERLVLYRNGLKTGEVIVAGPRESNILSADLVAGTAGVGHAVRRP